MNTEINNTKRKKRRTRKYLNEIRKRSRYNDQSLVKDLACDGSKVRHPNRNKNNNITYNRLTLSIFPKVVQSETITRPVMPILAEIKHKYNFNDIIKAKNSSKVLNTINNDIPKIKGDECHSSDTLLEAKEMIHHEKTIEEDESPFGNFVLVSPICRERKEDETLSNKSQIRPFSPIVQVENSELYENFMKKLSHLLRKQYPEKYFTYNPAKYFRAQIDKINSKIFESQVTKKTSIETDKSTRNKVVQNPVEYIRSAQTIPDVTNEPHNSSSSSTDSQAHLHSPLLFNETSIIQDTPEYHYYPHKLHQ